MAVWNEHLFPPGGWKFQDSDGITHAAGSLAALAAKVAEYRARRGIDMGNPIAEVHEQLCARFPGKCQKGDIAPRSGSTPAATPAKVPLSSRISAWLRSVWRLVANKKQEYVSEDETKRRMLICMKCPFYVPLPSECIACQETMNQISFQLRAGRDKYSAHLKACSKYGTDLRVDTLLKYNSDPNAPENCWKR